MLNTKINITTFFYPYSRKKGGIRLAEAEEGSDDNHSDNETKTRKKELEEEELKIKQQKEEANKKAKEDELWASFKKDTVFKPASKATTSKEVRCLIHSLQHYLKCL